MLRGEETELNQTRQGKSLFRGLAWVMQANQCHSMAAFFPGGLRHDKQLSAPVVSLVKENPCS
jgi:hypothetical protein